MFRKLRLPKFRDSSSSSKASISCLLLIGSFIIPGLLHAQSGSVYYPGPTGEWESRRPEDVGMNADALQKAVDFAMANEVGIPRDLRLAISNSFEPDNTIVGPTKDRGGPAGMVIKNGYIVAEWGDTKRVDMTFSVTKSYLSTIAGLALDIGLTRDAQERLGNNAWDDPFAAEHNSPDDYHLPGRAGVGGRVLAGSPDSASQALSRDLPAFSGWGHHDCSVDK